MQLSPFLETAKSNFLTNNDITTGLPSTSNLVEDLSMEYLGYPSIKWKLLCDSKYANYKVDYLLMKTKYKALDYILDPALSTLMGLIAAYNYAEYKFVDIDTSNIQIPSFTRSPQELPSCLTDANLQAAVSALVDTVGDLLSKAMKEGTEELRQSISLIMDKIQASLQSGVDAIGSLLSTIKSGIAQVEALVNSVFDSAKEFLFSVIEGLEKALEAVGFGEMFIRHLEMRDCIQTNCRSYANKLDSISFLYIDGDEDKGPKLPIDPYTGEFRLGRLYVYGDKYPFLQTPEGRRKLSQMEAEYSAYQSYKNAQICAYLDKEMNSRGIPKTDFKMAKKLLTLF